MCVSAHAYPDSTRFLRNVLGTFSGHKAVCNKFLGFLLKICDVWVYNYILIYILYIHAFA